MKEHFLVSGAGDEVSMNRKASLRAADQKMLFLIKLVPSRCVELMWHLGYPLC